MLRQIRDKDMIVSLKRFTLRLPHPARAAATV
jgi:hypothetical protein